MTMLRRVIAVLLTLLAGATQAQTPWVDSAGHWHDVPTSYTLACRGPLDIEVSMSASPPITMHFTRAHKPATSGVDSGTCAWIDREISAQEADCLQDYADDVAIRISTYTAATTGADRSTIGAAGAVPQSTAAQSIEQLVQEQTAGRTASAPVVVSGSSVRAPYIRFIATSSDPIAYFRAFAIAGRACLFVERVGP
jgi:hypothetical protein